MDEEGFLTGKATLVNDLGLHARSAAKIADIAGRARGGVYFIRDGETVNAKDMLDLLTIACPRGTTVTIRVDNPDDMETLEALVQLIHNGFGE